MNPQRVIAVVLFAVAFLTLVASRAFPFLDDISGVVETVIILAGVACALGGAYLWFRQAPDSRA